MILINFTYIIITKYDLFPFTNSHLILSSRIISNLFLSLNPLFICMEKTKIILLILFMFTPPLLRYFLCPLPSGVWLPLPPVFSLPLLPSMFTPSSSILLDPPPCQAARLIHHIIQYVKIHHPPIIIIISIFLTLFLSVVSISFSQSFSLSFSPPSLSHSLNLFLTSLCLFFDSLTFVLFQALGLYITLFLSNLSHLSIYRSI